LLRGSRRPSLHRLSRLRGSRRPSLHRLSRLHESRRPSLHRLSRLHESRRPSLHRLSRLHESRRQSSAPTEAAPLSKSSVRDQGRQEQGSSSNKPKLFHGTPPSSVSPPSDT